MTALRFIAMPTETALAYQTGERDANGQAPERQVSDGGGNPCRHCLTDIAKGEPFLVLAYSPFPALQPYAEVGPIFLHAEPCDRYDETAGAPPMFLERAQFLLRGYNKDNRIVYGSGQVIASADLSNVAAQLLQQPDVTYAHVRSASYNCFQCRIEGL